MKEVFKYRDYQEKSIEDGIAVLLSNKPKKSILISPTAGGKSLIIAGIVAKLDGNVLVIQPSKELLKQNLSKFLATGSKASVYSASMNSKEIGKVTYATDGSLKVHAFENSNIKYVIIDEAHLKTQSGSKLIQFINGIGVKNVLGLTATPIYLKNGADGSQLKMMNRVKGKLFNEICHVTQIKELVEKKYWSPLEYKIGDIDNSLLEYNSTGSDFTKESLLVNYEENNTEDKIVDFIKGDKNSKSILVFVPTIEQAEKLAIKIKGSYTVHSLLPTKERDFVVSGFKDLSIRVVINVNVLAVGFDHPQLDHIITARPTASIAMYYQQIGRGVRIHPTKDKCRITDLSGNVKKFGMVEDLTFENLNGYGWGLFSKEELLTAVPMWETERPTKASLTAPKVFIKEEPTEDVVIWFGKYSGKKVSQVVNSNPQYISWILTNKEWDWKSSKMTKLKKSLLSEMRKKFSNS
jgi:DNA repair protein RadD